MALAHYVVGFFALFGALMLLILFLYLVKKAIDIYKTVKKDEEILDSEFMDKIGLPCPTGWEIVRREDGKVYCKNNNVPVNEECQTRERVVFPEKKWEDVVSGRTSIQERCNFIKSCGPSPHIPATWFRVVDYC